MQAQNMSKAAISHVCSMAIIGKGEKNALLFDAFNRFFFQKECTFH